MIFALLLILTILAISYLVWMIERNDHLLIPSLKNVYMYPDAHKPSKPSKAFFPALLSLIALFTIIVFAQSFIKNNVGVKEAFLGDQHLGINTNATGLGSFPATSGAHFETLLPWKTFEEAVPDEAILHNMEDGGVVLWYRSGSKTENAQRQTALQDIASSFPKTIIVPRDNLQTTYMLTAWQRRLSFDEAGFDHKKALKFLRTYSSSSNHTQSHTLQ